MTRFLFRLLGYLGIGGGFVVLVLDGARSIANQQVEILPFGDVALRVAGERYLQLQPAIERNLHPFLWDPVLVTLNQAPGFAVVLAVGFLLLWLGQKPLDDVGYVTRS